uniref:Protein UL24/UL76 n=1 Tax=Anatid alphaherpesvirus 2 TaxID=3080522 RepID=A0AAU0K6S5_9ALPH
MLVVKERRQSFSKGRHGPGGRRRRDASSSKRRGVRGKMTVSAQLARKRRLAAGVRCHNKFYSALVRELTGGGCAAKRRAAAGRRARRADGDAKKSGPARPLLSSILLKAVSPGELRSATDVRLLFEVNLGRRRPDCICMMKLKGGDGNARGVCAILELKTCRFVRNMATASKIQQAKTGLRQLIESVGLVAANAPPGMDDVVVCPLLVFVSRRGLAVLRVTRLKTRHVRTDLRALGESLAAAAEYRPPSVGSAASGAKNVRGSVAPPRATMVADADPADKRPALLASPEPPAAPERPRPAGTAMSRLAGMISLLSS